MCPFSSVPSSPHGRPRAALRDRNRTRILSSGKERPVAVLSPTLTKRPHLSTMKTGTRRSKSSQPLAHRASDGRHARFGSEDSPASVIFFGAHPEPEGGGHTHHTPATSLTRSRRATSEQSKNRHPQAATLQDAQRFRTASGTSPWQSTFPLEISPSECPEDLKPSQQRVTRERRPRQEANLDARGPAYRRVQVNDWKTTGNRG